MNIDPQKLLIDLAERRPIFHSEADFQHELAWLLREQFRCLAIRLECPSPFSDNMAIDVLIRDGDVECAFELKYLCEYLETKVDGEMFTLKKQGAQAVRRYDVLKDISRMEQFVDERDRAHAFVIVLTNDPLYWTGPQREGTIDAAFSLREGRRASGALDWSEQTGSGTKRHRDAPIHLLGSYYMRWVDYSRFDKRFGTFRLLTLDVGNSVARAMSVGSTGTGPTAT